ncbi:hypothetical protein, partial [Nitrosococcus oceani]|uniref:hypothetical protein n=1 Tax=Nitrosococcus oceani TaxID=1229 RepID=UPI001E397FC1
MNCFSARRKLACRLGGMISSGCCVSSAGGSWGRFAASAGGGSAAAQDGTKGLPGLADGLDCDVPIISLL